MASSFFLPIMNRAEEVLDFRSDTVTKPSPEMWQALKALDNSKLGDDVEREDPTVQTLETTAAHLLGKEAALFVTSGTQGNLLSLLAQTTPGQEILLEEHSHIYKWEVGGAARLGGLMVKTFPSEKGMFAPADLATLIRDGDDIHEPESALICLENTHNYHGGIALPVELFKKTRQFADKFHLKLHIDGARIFNAAVARNVNIHEYTQYADSIQFCLSKGLCCPVGSIIAGSSEFIEKARKFRKMIGGGWRQAGILASMGLEALKPEWINRLKVDHTLAKQLAAELRDPQLGITVPEPDTNLVMVHLPKTVNLSKFEHLMAEKGILAHSMGPRIRLVTHFGLNSEDISKAAEIVKNLVRTLQ